MTTTDRQPDWDVVAPHAAMLAVIDAAEQAAHGRAEAASVVIADAAVSSAWLRVAAVRALAGLLAGPHAGASFDKLRAEAHELAAEVGADDEQVRLALAAIALAEAFERGQIGRCDQLVAVSEFSDLDVAHAASVLAGHVVAFLAGTDMAAVFATLRRQHGGER